MFATLGSPLERRGVPSWLEFTDVDHFSPVDGDWVTVYQSGERVIEADYGKLRHSFNVQPMLVDLDDLDNILEADPKSQAPNLRFYGGGQVWSRERGDYWDDGSTKELNGADVHRFLTHFHHDAPRVEYGILAFHDLVEEGLRNFFAHRNGEHVIRFSEEEWNERERTSGYPSDILIHMDIQTGYLLDYLDARQAALVLAYFQSRSIRNPTFDVGIADDGWTELELRGAPANKLSRYVDGLGSQYPHVELHWLCPVFPSSSDRSAEAEAKENRKIKFRTIDGNRYSPEDVEHQRGFEEAGLKRPAFGAESLQEAMSFYDWVFFDMEILEKYIASEDGYVNWWARQGGDVVWKDIFSERVYRNDEHEVALLLDDLEKIPDREIPHWKVHNITPVGEVPEEGIINFVLGKPVDSQSFSGRVLDTIEEIDEGFQGKYGEHAFSELQELDPVERVIMPPRNERDSLLTSMDALNKVFLERLNLSEVRVALHEERRGNVEGSKSALFELVASHAGEERAAELFKPINGIYDLRIVADHRGAESRWEQGIQSFGLEPELRDYRDAYIEIMEQLADSLEEISTLLTT